jgi:hypothetical protein
MTTIKIPAHLAQYIRTWNYERAALELDDPPPPHGMQEANRDSAVDLLHSIAMLLNEAQRTVTVKTKDGRTVAKVDPDTAKSIQDLDRAATEDEDTFR